MESTSLLGAQIYQEAYSSNYKGFPTVVWMAVVDDNYKFLFVPAGAPGSCSDGGIFRTSDLKIRIENKSLNIPEFQVPICLSISSWLVVMLFH